MAEIGLIASIVGVAATGAKLSLLLYQFADAVGSAARDVRVVATEISLFCSVLQQLDSTLQKAKAARYSLTALAAAEAIMIECRRVFREIQNEVDALKRESAGVPEEQLELIWTARVKWVFRRSKVLIYRRTLESMKTTLLVMLTTLRIGEKISLKGASTLDDESDQLVAQSLVITQQITLDDLHAEEKKVVEEQEEWEDQEEHEKPTNAFVVPEISVRTPESTSKSSLLRGDSPSQSDAGRKRTNRSSRVMGGFVETLDSNDSSTGSDLGGDNPAQRATSQARKRVDSEWLSETVFNDGLTLAARRESLVGDTAGTLAYSQFRSLLSRWVDTNVSSRLDPNRVGQRRRKSDNSLESSRPTQSIHLKPEIPTLQSVASPLKENPTSLAANAPHPMQTSPDSVPTTSQVQASALEPAHVFRNHAVGVTFEDKTPTVLLRYLRMFIHSASPKSFSLAVESDSKEKDKSTRRERVLEPKEKPLAVFRDLSADGRGPRLILRKVALERGEEVTPWVTRIVSLEGLAD
jgi:Ras association (RalGDS/AF-6) domain